MGHIVAYDTCLKMDAECESWLQANLPEFLDVFIENEFKTLESLSILDNDDLKEMGVSSVGKRKQILARTRTLKGSSFLPPVEGPHPSASTGKQTWQKCKCLIIQCKPTIYIV